jgi:hypothetical protein
MHLTFYQVIHVQDALSIDEYWVDQPVLVGHFSTTETI